MEREIALDTETTGFDPSEGHRIVEIGCVELVNRVPTGRTFHSYLNPERDMPQAAFNVHGLSAQFLSDKPRFAEIADDFLAFIGGDKLVIHNAEFDLRFLNAELAKEAKPHIPTERAFCTLLYARSRFPGAPNNLDALCKRFNVDLSARTVHGALLDAHLLAAMYLELMGGSQNKLALDAAPKTNATAAISAASSAANVVKAPLPPRPHAPTAEELQAHQAFIEKLKKPAWGN